MPSTLAPASPNRHLLMVERPACRAVGQQGWGACGKRLKRISMVANSSSISPADPTAMEDDQPRQIYCTDECWERRGVHVWIFDSQNLVISVIPHHAPWSATTEDYEISQQWDIHRMDDSTATTDSDRVICTRADRCSRRFGRVSLLCVCALDFQSRRP